MNLPILILFTFILNILFSMTSSIVSTNKEIEDETSNPGNGDNGSNDENQGGNNSNGGNTSNNNGSQDENNSNTTKPSNPQTGDASILGFVGVGIASIAGIFANNRRRKK